MWILPLTIFNAMNKKHLNISSILFCFPLKQAGMLPKGERGKSLNGQTSVFNLVSIMSKLRIVFVQTRFFFFKILSIWKRESEWGGERDWERESERAAQEERVRGGEVETVDADIAMTRSTLCPPLTPSSQHLMNMDCEPADQWSKWMLPSGPLWSLKRERTSSETMNAS